MTATLSRREQADLVTLAQAGDLAAFSRLYELLSPRIRAYAWKRLRHTQLTNDTHQETFTHAWAKLASFKADDPKSNFLAWLYTICGNLIRDHFKRHDTRRTIVWSQYSAVPMTHNQHDPLFYELESGYELVCRDRNLSQAVASLPSLQRAMVYHRFVLDHSLEQTATALGVSVPSVKSGTNRAMITLRSRLHSSVTLDTMYN